MEIVYDIVVDDANGRGKEFLDSGLLTKADALNRLREQRTTFPKAYLVKCVETRCREPRSRRVSGKHSAAA